VDLDAAFGRGSNQDLLEQVIDATDLFVELSGGFAVKNHWCAPSTWERPGSIWGQLRLKSGLD
jgi:hypothetical protein